MFKKKKKNPIIVVNNLIKEDIRMKNIKKFLTIILAISILFAISCGDRPTGSTPIQSEGTLMIGSEQLKVNFFNPEGKSDFNSATSIEIGGKKFILDN